MKTPWIIADAVKQVFRCERCGEEVPMSEVLPSKIDDFVKWANKFERKHKKCKPDRAEGEHVSR